MSKLKFAFGPMSIEFIDAISSYSKSKKLEVMLIASRNQIECKEFGGGYVNNFTTEKFSKYIKEKKNKKIKLCRDHSGPFLSDSEKKLSYKDAIERTKISLKADIESDFSMLHIDTSKAKKKFDLADELFDFCNTLAKEKNKKIKFEFGTEDHGIKYSYKQFLKDLNFFCEIKNSNYLVCQTGSLVKEIYQVGEFDFKNSKKMSKFAKKKNIFLKEHNCDYISVPEINLRKKAGIGAMNVAPEIGVLQTNLTIMLAKELGLERKITAFKKIVLNKDKWVKWLYASKISDHQKLSISGHYFFSTQEYYNLKKEINKRVNFIKILNKTFYKYLDRFYGA